ncbi:ATP-binding protein [Streptomyces sp. NBC_01476]|uniref:ATP-binding protein n=1 Tax=Streptomyces sp. NBC_01476 TaxID=2903881 RepID=UPI003FCE1417
MVAQEVPTSTTMALPHGPTGVADARRRLRTDLYAQDVPEPVIDDAVLILSELLSNSCRHARPLGSGDDVSYGEPRHPRGRSGRDFRGEDGRSGRGSRGDGKAGPAGAQAPADPLRPDECADRAGIRAAWSIGEDGLLLLEVTDGGGPTRPRPASPSLTAHGGRGLGIVGSLTQRWGVRDAPGEVTVWALLPVRGRHARRDDVKGTGIGLPIGVPLELPLDLAESLDDLA